MDPIYRGIWFVITPNTVLCEFGDGAGGNNPAFRRGKQASVTNIAGRWVNVSAVMNSQFDIRLYINGIDIGGSSSGGSNLSMKSPTPGDLPKIGYFLSNNVVYRDRSIMDEIRLWNKALTELQIRQDMCKKLVGNESGLIGYWNFNETSGDIVFDKSSNMFNGQLIGNPTRVFSGAPIGDVSTYLYSTSWAGKTITLQDVEHKIDVKNVSGLVDGIQIYEVKNSPSQSSGLDVSLANKPYFGVFACTIITGSRFDAEYSFNGNSGCKSFIRSDNSKPLWSKSNNPVAGVLERSEIISVAGAKAIFDLGPDKTLCDQSSSPISTGITDPQFTFQWNTGQTSSAIVANQSGQYKVNVFGPCGVDKDSVLVSFVQTPKPISLGRDVEYCELKPINLKPLPNPQGFNYLWQDGSTADNFAVKEFGKYWVTVKNFCGQASDTIVFSLIKPQIGFLPNIITPNGDKDNEFFLIDERIVGLVSLQVINRWGEEVFFSQAYDNKWNGGDLSSGVYFILLSGACIDKTKSSLTIIK